MALLTSKIRSKTLGVAFFRKHHFIGSLVCSGGYASALNELSSALATIDVFTSLARLVTDAASEYVRPKLEPMGKTSLLY